MIPSPSVLVDLPVSAAAAIRSFIPSPSGDLVKKSQDIFARSFIIWRISRRGRNDVRSSGMKVCADREHCAKSVLADATSWDHERKRLASTGNTVAFADVD